MSSKIDRRTTKYGARFRITVPEDRQRNIIQRLERQSKQTHWRIRQKLPTIAVQTRPRPTAHLHHYHGRSSQSMLPTSATNVLLSAISSGTPGSGPSQRPAYLIKISALLSLDSMSSQHPATGPGRRGIALGIPSCFGGHEHGSAVGTMILRQGHSGATTNYSRREAFASIRQALDRVVPFDNNHPVLILETGTPTRSAFSALSTRGVMVLTVMQFSGSQITRLSTVHGRRHSQTAVADHFVIRTSIRAEAQGQPPVPRAPTISRHHCLEATDQIATSNYWDVLADGATDDTDTDTDIHQLTSQFLESANAVADNLSLRLSPPGHSIQSRLLSGTTKRCCHPTRESGWSQQWVKHADNLDRAVSDGRTDLVFSAARAMSGNSFRSAAVIHCTIPIGIVQYDPTSILRVMQGHYGSLAADTTGHSLDLQYWHDRQPIQASPNTRPSETVTFSTRISRGIRLLQPFCQMSPRKAPGDDGITTAFYQAALYMPANTQEGVPPTPFARALLRICGQVFASATIPRAWLCASIVSIDKKDGDPLNPGDKRGIALINVGLKLVCKVLQMRIERFVETNNLLSYEQAGFRKREECVGQVAFDTVPVGALLWKLQNMGFPRRTLAFLKALYTSSSARARAGSLLSDPFPIQRGVRQGWSIVWTAVQSVHQRTFSMVSPPITVPGLPRDTNPIRGLMYADDVAVFADSEQSLLAASTAIEQWANQWEMQFGVAKCGIISFHWPSSTTT
ncbi:hypothetical protein BASA83_005358 [Batrachochytrium salamandrivorans]|nr:hypothetical protein BASA83_005358 [Batrachochytrium salamandrivorans]